MWLKTLIELVSTTSPQCPCILYSRYVSLFFRLYLADLPGSSPICSPETLPTTSLLSHRVGPKQPYTVVSCQSSTPRAPPSSSIRESLWAPETDDTYEPSILAASPSVQSVSFPQPQDISFDASILRPTASAYTSQEPSSHRCYPPRFREQ